MRTDFENILTSSAQIIENELKSYLNVENSNGLNEIMGYSLLSNGKRIRPFIVIEAYKLFSKSTDIKPAIPYACALEMIHTYSLIHDDLPCMDNDDFRRGKPTNHMVYGEDMALLAGDALLTYAFEVLANNNYVSDKSVRLATIALSKYSGFAGMAGGQMIDLNIQKKPLTYEEIKNMHALKTAALIKCALVLGYLAADDAPKAEIVSDLEKFAQNIGIAFQIRDDILDKISNSDTLGKPVGSDEKNQKTTSLSFLSLSDAEAEVKCLTNEAINTIIKYYEGYNGEQTLIELANYMINRQKWELIYICSPAGTQKADKRRNL